MHDLMPVPDSSIFFFFDRMKTHINTCSAHSEHMVFIWSARSCISLVCQIIWFAKSSAPSPTRSSDVAQYITSPQGARTRIILACDTRKIEDVVARYISRYGRTLLFHNIGTDNPEDLWCNHCRCPDDDTMHIEGTARCAADTDPAQAIQHVGASIQIVGASIVLQIRQGQRLSDRDDMVWHTSRAFPDVFICSCTEQIMTDPVVTVDGQVYERSFIEEWF